MSSAYIPKQKKQNHNFKPCGFFNIFKDVQKKLKVFFVFDEIF